MAYTYNETAIWTFKNMKILQFFTELFVYLHVSVGGLCGEAIGVADLGAQHSQSGAEKRVGAPEATHSESSRLIWRRDAMHNSGLDERISLKLSQHTLYD